MVSATGIDRNGGAGSIGGIDGARNQPGRDEGTRRIVDQDDVRPFAGERFEPGMDRGLPRRAAIRRRLVAQPADRGVEHADVVGMENRLHGRDRGCRLNGSMAR